ncbi:flagellar motor protein [Paenibacillus gallinarum]|uniref:Flagellar motor protein n=1 Tax=Paenibacillus gallinarum TaxID=2762232 RepID=A0ABR8SZU6_9BACL|nr:flagellar motor protein [Paenibacillus gallinarum]MBD7968910.1 flagellar motor protein [Paenibacillus gallinarum]
MDIATLIGLIAGAVAIIGGFLWEGGQITGLFQFTAALIVFGGTIAAILISYPMYRIRTIPAALRMAFRKSNNEASEWIDDIVEMSMLARREGVLALEHKVMEHSNDFLKNGIQMVVDGTDQPVVQQIMELEIDAKEQKHDHYAKIFESAGAYAPTMGIIGTVMGLVQVLGSLTDPTELGPSIAVAFIATLYGVASANLIFLPIASKIRAKSEEETSTLEMLLEGVLSVQNGENALLVRKKLETYALKHKFPEMNRKEKTHETAE